MGKTKKKPKQQNKAFNVLKISYFLFLLKALVKATLMQHSIAIV